MISMDAMVAVVMLEVVHVDVKGCHPTSFVLQTSEEAHAKPRAQAARSASCHHSSGTPSSLKLEASRPDYIHCFDPLRTSIEYLHSYLVNCRLSEHDIFTSSLLMLYRPVFGLDHNIGNVVSKLGLASSTYRTCVHDKI